MTMEQQTNNEPFYRKWWVIASGVIIVIGIFGLPGFSRTPKITSPTAQTTEQVIDKQFVKIANFNGMGQRKSDKFIITGERFKVVYNCTGETNATYCGAMVYKTGSKLPQIFLNNGHSSMGEAILMGDGEYYLFANTTGTFTMTVYDYR